MKKLAIIFLFLGACCYERPEINSKPYYISFSNDGRWTTTRVYCDSFKMVTKTRVEIYVDGTTMVVESNDILPGTNY